MHRFTARIGSAVAIFVLLATGIVRADSISYSFDRTNLTFTHVARYADGVAIGSADPALRVLLRSLGAAMTWRSGDRQVLIATAAPEVISFAAGDAHYSIGAITAQARFAPQFTGGEVFLPFDDLMHALGIGVQGAVLERLLTSVDVQGYGNQAIVVARGAGILHPRMTSDGENHLSYVFAGLGTTLSGLREINVAGIRTLEVTSSGTARDPQTIVTLSLDPGTRHDAPQFGSGEFEVAFGANGSVPPLVQPLSQTVAATQQNTSAAAPLPPPPPSDMVAALATATPSPVSTTGSTAGTATVNGAAVKHNDDGSSTVTIEITGNAHYEWHRLRDPDNRFWVDISSATLAGAPRDENETGPLVSMRVRQIDPQTVRVALSFTGDNAIAVSPSATGVIVNVGNDIVADGPREGNGSIGSVVSANEPQTTVTPVPPDEYGMNSGSSADQSDWKFSPHNAYVPTNPKLIVLDPGHGGSDRGSVHGDLTEAVLNLDISKRVRELLLARGWQVQMTHDTDIDVYQPNDSARDELQARDNIANHAGARLFVSIHCNAYLNAGPNGTTIYYSKPSDIALADALDRALDEATLGTKDDGTVKSKFWVTLHANMPAALIETAFESNPSDAVKLESPRWRQQVAQAIANGIDAYAQAHPVAGSAQ
jgi:N-acetylmuramoyl-L-alanine amidase